MPRPSLPERTALMLASTMRARVLELCQRQALTNKEIAQRLGRDPATVFYHVRQLVAAGFLERLPARRGAHGAREIPYRMASACQLRSFSAIIDPRNREELIGRLYLLFEEFAARGDKALGQTWTVVFVNREDG